MLLSRRLELMPAHDSLFSLLNVLTAHRLMYLLRSTLCIDSPELPLCDAVLRESLFAKLNVDLTTSYGVKHFCPCTWWGGLGIRSVVLLVPSNYLAAAASTMKLTSTLLSALLQDVKDSLDQSSSQPDRSVFSISPQPQRYNVYRMITAAKYSMLNSKTLTQIQLIEKVC